MSETLGDPRIREGMRAQTALRQKLLDGGAKQIGWKVGFGAPAAMEKLRLTAPLVGFILDRAALASGAKVSLSDWTKPAAEAEIAAYIGRDLPAGSSRDEVRQIYRTRMALEGLAAHDFAAYGAPAAKQRLAAIQDELNAHEGEVDHEGGRST